MLRELKIDLLNKYKLNLRYINYHFINLGIYKI